MNTQNGIKSSAPLSNLKWYDEGLRFQCTGCGQCCTGSPGYVWLKEEDILLLSEHLKLSRESFLKIYARKIGLRFSLKETAPHYDCIFLKDNKCSVYAERPIQCRTFPWWPQNIESEEEWKLAGLSCEGINHPDAPLISKEEIEKARNLS